jgi:hypothetical protein
MSGPLKPQPAPSTPSQHPYHVARSTKNGGVVISENADSSGH